MNVFYATLAIVGGFFALMSVRIIFLKDGKFKGTCASQSPFLNKEGVTCSLCGKEVTSETKCDEDDGEETSEVNKVLSKF